MIRRVKSMNNMDDFNKLIIIQDTWDEDDDLELLEYIRNKNYKVLSEEKILEMNKEFIYVLFADTKIVQEKINYEIPTYPKCFESIYKRKIQIEHIRNLTLKDAPYFIKPYKNDKSFSATVVQDKYDIEYIKENTNDVVVYKSEYKQYVNEYRLFIYNYQLYAIQESSYYILNNDIVESCKPPVEFLKEILKHNTYPCIVIDIGQYKDGDNKIWSFVESNPPYSISSYDLPICKYFEYCQLCWKYMLKNEIKI